MGWFAAIVRLMSTVDTAERTADAEPAPPVLGKSRRNLVFVTIMLGMLTVDMGEGFGAPDSRSAGGGSA